jgi:undecaprenyl-diphosphatase
VLRALILGIVQGITEFLPISSSAHLSIVPRLLGYPTPTLAFEVLLHFGTLAAVVAYFARDLWAFVLCLVAPGRLGPGEARVRRRLLGLLALASVPAAVVGFLLQDWADEQTTRPLRASVWLVLTTAIMIAAELYARSRSARAAPAGLWTTAGSSSGGRLRSPTGGPGTAEAGSGAAEAGTGTAGAGAGAAGAGAGTAGAGAGAAGGTGTVGARADAAAPAGAEEELRGLPVVKAAGIGLAQALALVPGTSRSGVTISAGLFLGVTREAAARFSFLLSIPAILGAGILKLDELSGATETPAELVGGTVAAAVSGFLAVSLLLRLLRTRTLWPFIWYRLVAGGLFVLLLSTVRA